MDHPKTSPAKMPAKPMSAPIPLADRRRLVRPDAKPGKPGPVFTDWASI